MKWLALCLCLLPLSAGAQEHPFLASLVDSLSRPDLSAPELVAGMEAAGFSVEATISYGPNSAEDPFYYFLSATAIFPGREDPSALFDCSRIGDVLLPTLPTKEEAIFGGAVSRLTFLQFRDTVEFAPGAQAQLRCEVSIIPMGEAPMPTVDQIATILRTRFDEQALDAGPNSSEDSKKDIGWLLYPPLSATPGDEGLKAEDTQLTAKNSDAMADRRASWISYSHRAGLAVQSFTLVSHLAPQGF